MNPDNFGHGYQGFKAAIDMVADALGGEHVRAAVAQTFVGVLCLGVRRRRGDKYASRHTGGTDWSAATEADFDAARVEGLRIMSPRNSEPVAARALWKGAELVLRGVTMYLEAREQQMYVGAISEHSSWSNREQKNVPSYGPHIADDGLRLLSGTDSTYAGGHSQPKSRTAKTPESAVKSLISLFEDFFGVKFERVREPADAAE